MLNTAASPIPGLTLDTGTQEAREGAGQSVKLPDLMGQLAFSLRYVFQRLVFTEL